MYWIACFVYVLHSDRVLPQNCRNRDHVQVQADDTEMQSSYCVCIQQRSYIVDGTGLLL
jgi:hypothetical protein